MRALLLPLAFAAPQDDFEAKIRPLLHDRCVECHGEHEPKASLRLDDPAGIRAGSDVGPVIVPGDVEASRLAQVISYEDPHAQMPPSGKLPEAELELLREWIAAGAVMPEGDASRVVDEFDMGERLQHWSYQPITDPDVPPADGWSRATADRFVHATLAEAGLSPAEEASRIEWLRRATFDLTGLPPTPAQVDAFLADGDPGAHDRVADRLLASPDFGETWGRYWLDLVRYAETKGHEFDYTIPNAWRYRDYVVRAFDADVPYDRLVLEHLAGDLLEEPRPHPTEGWDESPLGTGWWWLGEEMHSPVDIRGDETDRLYDQLDVFGKAFLGLTVACARCHDHKADPITQRDYYSLSGFVLSSPYRQVRYETREHNARVAADLNALRARHEGAVRRAVGEGMEAELGAFEDVLRAAARAIQEPVVVEMAPPSYLDDPANDLLVADFEGDDWGGWKPEGEAFGGERPPRIPELHGSLRGCGAIGQGLLSSHDGWRDGKRANTDDLKGQIISPPIRAQRDYLHFLVGGGRQPEYETVELWVGGEMKVRVTGESTNFLKPARFDLRPYRGQDVEVRLFDRFQKGWGHILADHFVLSDREGPEALDVRLYPAEAYGRRAAASRAAAEFGVDADRVERALDWLESGAEADARNPLALVGRVAQGAEVAAAREQLRSGVPAALSLPEDALVHADYSAEGRTRWTSDGPLWTRRDAGAALLTADEGRPLERVEPLGAATVDPAWSGLRSTDSERDSGRLNYERSGRSLITPSFELTGGRLFYLVRGRGRAYAAVDSHKLLHGPLHGRLVQDLKAEGGYRWIQHDLTRYTGHRLHIEFSPHDGDSEFAVVQVVEAGGAPGGAWWPSPTWLDAEGDPFTVAATHLREVAAGLATGAVDPGGTASVDWLLANLWEAPPEAVLSRTAAFRAALGEVLEARRLESRTAPALLDGSGVDERLLARGQARAAGDRVPRAFLSAVDGSPVEAPGSGRLELARRLVRTDNPLVSRAWVNRVWSHLFARGLAPSVDDLGLMGTGPGAHAPLLDHMARRFMGEHGWSTKALLRELVLSSTYRQASRAEAAADALDPENLLLHRMPVKRLTAEALRDAILAVSGDLDPARFGRPVPIHLTDFMQGRGRPGSGPLDGNRRRSVYLSVRRNFLMPFLMAFDFPVPSVTRGQRSLSNVPAQALTLLNDPFVHQQAERWADRALQEHAGAEDAALVEALFRRALGRGPEAEETAALVGLLEGDRREAVVDLCHVLFNLKEFRHLR